MKKVMRNVLPLLISFLFFSVSAVAQSNEMQVCPSIIVIGPAGVISPGEAATFAAEVTNANKVKGGLTIVYEWTVTEGTIETGQGTPSIVVRTEAESTNKKLSATLKIKGLPRECVDQATETAELVAAPRCGLAVDEYGKVSANEEKVHLDNDSIYLSQNPNFIMSIILFLEPNEGRASALMRVARIRKHLITARGLNRDRIRFYFAEGIQRSTSFYVTSPELSDSPRQAFNASERIDDLRPLNALPKKTKR